MSARLEVQISGVIEATDKATAKAGYVALLAAIDGLQNPGTTELKFDVSQYYRGDNDENLLGEDFQGVIVPGDTPLTNHQIGQDSSKPFTIP